MHARVQDQPRRRCARHAQHATPGWRRDPADAIHAETSQLASGCFGQTMLPPARTTDCSQPEAGSICTMTRPARSVSQTDRPLRTVSTSRTAGDCGPDSQAWGIDVIGVECIEGLDAAARVRDDVAGGAHTGTASDRHAGVQESRRVGKLGARGSACRRGRDSPRSKPALPAAPGANRQAPVRRLAERTWAGGHQHLAPAQIDEAFTPTVRREHG